MQRVALVDHPAVAGRLARLRDAQTPGPLFRRLLEEVGSYVAYEATRGLPVEPAPFVSPVGPGTGRRIATAPVVAPILRAGLGLLPGFLAVVEDAVVAHVGLFRDPQSLAAVPYYVNVPAELAGRDVFVLDPMLATGHSAAAALEVLGERGARDVTLLCVIAAPRGIAHLTERFTDLRIVTCAIDERLNEHGYIVPGLGDAGDRMFGSVSSVPQQITRRTLNGEPR